MVESDETFAELYCRYNKISTEYTKHFQKNI